MSVCTRKSCLPIHKRQKWVQVDLFDAMSLKPKLAFVFILGGTQCVVFNNLNDALTYDHTKTLNNYNE